MIIATIKHSWRFIKGAFKSKSSQFFFFLTFVFLVGCLYYYGKQKEVIFLGYQGDLAFNLVLAGFGGFFVGFIVEALQTYHRTHHITEILSFIDKSKSLPVITADRSIDMKEFKKSYAKECAELNAIGDKLKAIFDAESQRNTVDRNIRLLSNLLYQSKTGGPGENYRDTGPGEAIAIGLLYSCFVSDLNGDRSKIEIMSPEIDNEKCHVDYQSQRIILGGPNYNKLTRTMMSDKTPHYDVSDPSRPTIVIPGETPFPAPPSKEYDYGLIYKKGKQLHVSGCRTWGVAAAAECVFTEAMAEMLVNELEHKIPELKNSQRYDKFDFWAVVKCAVPNPAHMDYQIGDIEVKSAGKL